MYMLNGLNEKFDNISNVIKHQKPFPSFDDAKSMLQDEETRLKKANKATASHGDHASSSSALVAVSSPAPAPSTTYQQPKSYNNRNKKRNNNMGKGRSNYNQPRPPYPSWPLHRTGQAQLHLMVRGTINNLVLGATINRKIQLVVCSSRDR